MTLLLPLLKKLNCSLLETKKGGSCCQGFYKRSIGQMQGSVTLSLSERARPHFTSAVRAVSFLGPPRCPGGPHTHLQAHLTHNKNSWKSRFVPRFSSNLGINTFSHTLPPICGTNVEFRQTLYLPIPCEFRKNIKKNSISIFRTKNREKKLLLGHFACLRHERAASRAGCTLCRYTADEVARTKAQRHPETRGGP